MLAPSVFAQSPDAPAFASPACVRATILERPAPFTEYLPTRQAYRETATPDAALKERPDDRWLGPDKVKHAAFSFLWTLGSQYTLVNKADLSERRALPFSVAASSVVGLSKEVYDRQAGRYHYFSHRDLVADAFGIALAVALILL